jgi:geranylgeranyl reductase family protein
VNARWRGVAVTGIPDVIVVGAGPSGSVAAMLLARAGVRVRLLDRATFPRDKLCGDTLNPGSLSLLDQWGMAERIRGQALTITGMTVTGPGGEAISADYPGGLTGVSLTRREMDVALVEVAVASGAAFDTGVTVLGPEVAGGRVTGVRTATGTVPARLVIAADGRGSRLASSLRLSRFARAPRRWAYGAYFEGVDGLSSHGEMHIRGGGYIGVAPLPGGIANACVVRTNPRGSQAQVIEQALAADPLLGERFARARVISPTTVLGPLAIDASAAGCPGLLLAGDAAGFVDPMTGDGLRFALSGGALAADAALRELASGVPAWRSLDAARASAFTAKWRVNRALRAVVGSRRALGVAALVARQWPGSVGYLIGVAGDVSLARV